ncbi:potassium transporter TrkG [Streptomyces sp. NPDC058442]|uniref:potassium transporter TrkG n=1 Tax=Streptomyces sp. NPDC058442 TaxID=3346503 RepID=UPI00364CF966
MVRHLVLFRFARRELEQAVHPDAVLPVRVSGRVVDDPVLRSALVFALLHLLALALGTFGLALDAETNTTGTGAFTALGAAAACLGNVGPAFGEVGPFGSYAPLGHLSKAILTALMFLGRVEIVPLAVLLRRGYWHAEAAGPPASTPQAGTGTVTCPRFRRGCGRRERWRGRGRGRVPP